MKKLLLLLCLFGAAVQSRATHLMGGDITVYPNPTTPGTYMVKVVHYRDTAGIQASQNITIFVHQWDPVLNAYSPTSGLQTFLYLDYTQSGMNLPNFPYGVQVNTYTTYNWSPLNLQPGKYRADVTECCRNAAIMNMSAPLSESMTLSAEFVVPVPTTGTNTSPQFLAMPIVYLPVNQPWTYNPLPYDVDGDSISWAMATPNSDIVAPNNIIINPVAGYTAPMAAASGPFALNPITGEVSWTPNTIGHFVASFKITEYKNGVPSGSVNRDMQYVVIASVLPSLTFTNVTTVNTNTAGGYKYMYYQPGQPLQFKIRGGDGSNSDISMRCYSGLFQKSVPPTFAAVPTGSANTVEGTFSWTPSSTQVKDEVVVFRLGNGTFSKDYTLLLRNKKAAAIGTAPLPVSDLNAYPNPASNSLSISLHAAANADLTLQLVDATGRIAQKLFSGQIPKGQWSMSFDLHGAGGIYFLQAVSGGKLMAVKQVTVVQ